MKHRGWGKVGVCAHEIPGFFNGFDKCNSFLIVRIG